MFVSEGVDMLIDVGLYDELDVLLKVELLCLFMLYYFMLGLVVNVKVCGDKVVVFDWYCKVYDLVNGLVMKLCWGVIYFVNVVELVLNDVVCIEGIVVSVFV